MKAVLNVPWADLREKPIWLPSDDLSHNNLRLTQVLYNEPLIVHKQKDDWLYVEVLEQPCFIKERWSGYMGYLHQSEIREVSKFPTPRFVVCTHDYEYPYGTSFPGHREHSKDLRPIEPNSETLRQEALSFIGRPYLWGGMSTHGIDCSALVHLLYRAQGILLPRNAHDQYLKQIKTNALYLYPKEAPERITHVVLQLDKQMCIEAPQTGEQVRLLRWGKEIKAKKEGLTLQGRPSLYNYVTC